MDGVQRAKRGTESKVTSGEWYYQKEKNRSLRMSMTAYSLKAVTPSEDKGFQMRDGGGVHLRHLRSCSIHCLHQNSVDSHLPDSETSYQFSSVQSLSHVWLFVTPWTATHQASLSITNSRSLLKLMSIESVIPSNHLILCGPLLLLPLIFPSIRVFSNESVLHIRWPEYWSFSFSISPSNEHPGLISFRLDWLDLLAVQGTLKSLLQHHSSKASILQCSAFFIVWLSYDCWKNHSLD